MQEWRRFEGTQEGVDLRTNKDVAEARQFWRWYDAEMARVARETPEQREAYVHEFLRRSREVQRTLRVAGPEVPRRMGGAAVKGRGGAQHGSGKVGRGKGTGGKKGPSGALGGLLESFSDSEAGD